MAASKKKASSPGKTTAGKKTTRTTGSKAGPKKGKKSTAGKGSAKIKLNKAPAPKIDLSILKDVLLILFLVFCILLFVSCFVSTGSVLRWMHNTSFSLFGYLAYLVPFILLGAVLYCLLAEKNMLFALRLTALFLLFSAVEAILSILFLSGYNLTYGGGKIGDSIVGVTMKSFGIIGSYLLMAAVIIIALLLFFGRSFLEGMQYRKDIAWRALKR